MAHEDLELRLRRTGGLSGLAMEASLATGELAVEEGRRIRDALARVDLADLSLRPSSAPGAADMFDYRLEVRRAGRAETYHFGERQVPAELAPIIRALMDRAEPGR